MTPFNPPGLDQPPALTHTHTHTEGDTGPGQQKRKEGEKDEKGRRMRGGEKRGREVKRGGGG